MKKLARLLCLTLVLLAGCLYLYPGKGNAAFVASRLIDDSVMDSYTSMNAAQIDTWLNGFSSSCISPNSGFEARVPAGYMPIGGFTYGGFGTAGQVIATASQVYEINPKVLLVTLEKEQSLVTGRNNFSGYCNNGDEHKYAAAAGYGCPDGGTVYNWSGVSLYRRSGTERTVTGSTCVNTAVKAGFSQQVIRAAWLLKFGEQRSKGNTGWAIIKPGWNNSDDPSTCYGGPMTQGFYKRCSTDSGAAFDGLMNIDGQTTHMDTGGTAALYWYTPHFHGNQNFVSLYESWFGPTTSLAGIITMTNISQPDATPALGQTISYTISLTNTFSEDISIDAVGIVGRLGSLSGTNRDLGWQGPIVLEPGVPQQFTFTSVVKDLGTLYMWPSIQAQGSYTHYNNWGLVANSHTPNLTLITPLDSSLSSPVAGQTTTLTATLKNNEDQPVTLDALGVPVRYLSRYSYDTGWVPSVTLNPGSTKVLTGNVLVDKPGSYTAWVSGAFGSQYVTYSSTLNINASTPIPNFQLTYTETPVATPALGQDVYLKFKLKNNSGVPMTLNAVGVVGRYGNPYSGANKDFGWQGPLSFDAKEEKSFTTFSANISELRAYFSWVAINYQGRYIHFNNWGFMLVPHKPALLAIVPLTINSGVQPLINQSVNVTATVKNLEPYPIRFSALGLPARYMGVYNYDTAWQGPGVLAAKTDPGDSITLSGAINFNKPGPYTVWTSAFIQGNYITVGDPKTINMQ